MEKLPLISTAPGAALGDQNLSDAEFRLLSLIASRSGTLGCKDTNALLGGVLGASPAVIRGRVEGLLKSGYLMEVEGPKRTLQVCFLKMEMREVKDYDHKRDIFDPKNALVDDKQINHLIAVFLKFKINKNVLQSKELESQFYGNPHNRDGAKKLIRTHGMPELEKVIEAYAGRIDEIYCPKAKSLKDLQKKWPDIKDYINKPEDVAIKVIE